jgi:hypothetical protein
MKLRIKLEINNPIGVQTRQSELDMIVRENMTIGSLKKVLDVPEEYTDKVMVNGVKRSEYYSLNPGDQIIFEAEMDCVKEEKVKNEEKF